MNAARIDIWKEFCTKQKKETMWDGINRVIRKTMLRYEDQLRRNGGCTLSSESSVKLLGATFFPDDDPQHDSEIHAEIRTKAAITNDEENEIMDDPPITEVEMMTAARSFSAKKAPGNDGFTADICLQAITAQKEIYLEIINRCLQLGFFPEKWKITYVLTRCKPKTTAILGLIDQ